MSFRKKEKQMSEEMIKDMSRLLPGFMIFGFSSKGNPAYKKAGYPEIVPRSEYWISDDCVAVRRKDSSDFEFDTGFRSLSSYRRIIGDYVFYSLEDPQGYRDPDWIIQKMIDCWKNKS
jgi:hypothetical protein